MNRRSFELWYVPSRNAIFYPEMKSPFESVGFDRRGWNWNRSFLASAARLTGGIFGQSNLFETRTAFHRYSTSPWSFIRICVFFSLSLSLSIANSRWLATTRSHIRQRAGSWLIQRAALFTYVPINRRQWIRIVVLHTAVRVCVVVRIVSRRRSIAKVTQH